MTASRTSRYVDSPIRISIVGRVLLQASRGVDGVPGHESLPAGHVAGDDLPGVHAGPVLQAHPEPLVQHLVHVDEPLLHLERGPDRTHGVVLVEAREPEHGHDRVADVLLDRPPCRSSTSRISLK